MRNYQVREYGFGDQVFLTKRIEIMPFWMGRWTGATGRGAYTATLYRGQRPRETFYGRYWNRSPDMVKEEDTPCTPLSQDRI